MSEVLVRQVNALSRWLDDVYALDLSLDAGRCVVEPAAAGGFLPPGSPPSGVLVVEEEGEVFLGLYIDPADGSLETIVEETSHLVCLAWHASRERSVSGLQLELQADVDRFVFRHLNGGDPFAHFERFRLRDDLPGELRSRYLVAHRSAQHYCRGLRRRFPGRSDIPALLAELRRFYREDPIRRLAA